MKYPGGGGTGILSLEAGISWRHNDYHFDTIPRHFNIQHQKHAT